MNQLTRDLIANTAPLHKTAAADNGPAFREIMRAAHWDYLLDSYGVDLKKRAMALLESMRPDLFDPDGFISSQADYRFDLDYRLSTIAVQVLNRKIERDPDLQLCYDWGDLPVLTVTPQLALF